MSCLKPKTSDGNVESAKLLDYIWIGVGIFLGTLGSVLINLGNNLQALGMHRTNALKAKPRWAAATNSLPTRAHSGQVTSIARIARDVLPADSDKTRSELRKWRLVHWFGTFIFVFGSFINFAAFALAAASVLAPLEAVQFITNLVFGSIVHGHTISGKMKIGSVLTAMGTIIAVSFGPMSVNEFEIDDLLCFWEAPLWIAYVVLAYAAAMLIMIYWYFANQQLEKSRAEQASAAPPTAHRNGNGPPAAALAAVKPWKYSMTFLPVAYALSSALIGTQSVVQAKCLSEIVSMLVLGKAEQTMSSFFTYVVIAYFIGTVGFWLYRLNDALGKYDTLFIIPLLQASYIIFATIAGGTYFQEFATLGWGQFLAFFGGIAVMLVGLCLLIPANPENTER